MYDTYKSYTAAFLIAGMPPMIFGILLTTTRCVRKRTMEIDEKNPNEPKLLSPVIELGDNKEGKPSDPTIVSPKAEHLLLLSNTNYPNYTR